MGNTNSNNYNLSFEDMEWIINHYSRLSNKVIIIHTLDTNQEDVLIKHTTFAIDENDKINSFLKVTMIHGSKDKSVPVNYSRKVLKIFKNAKKKLVIVKNGDHSLSSQKWLNLIKKELKIIIN